MLSRAWNYWIVSVIGLLAFAASCANEPAEEPFELSVRWGLTGTSTLPADVAEIELVTCVRDGQEETCDRFSCSVDALRLMRAAGPVETCRPAEGTEMYGDDPVFVRQGLPTHVPIRFQLRGKDAGGAVVHVGQTGPFVLGEGERRFQSVWMYPIGETMPFAGASVARLMHTSTYLPDGRILIAGGFDTAERMAECPEDLGVPEGSRCFSLTATDRALAFDPASRTVASIRAPMLAPRAGHTASTLPDGRVLLAGGAPAAVMAMVPQGAAAAGGYRIELVPLLADGSGGAHDSFELFDAFLGPEPLDADRDGDLERGAFLGTAGASTPGPLNQPRFMHAAATIDTAPERVLLVGGLGSEASAGSYEVFDADKPGGFGVYRADANALLHPRPMPGAIGLAGGQVWILGGHFAGDNQGLAEVWEPSADDPNGSVVPATAIGEFPNAAPATMQPHPEYVLVKPAVARIDGGQRALVVGWYGTQCEVGTSTPIFASESSTTEYCNSPTSPATRSFTVSAASGLTAPTDLRPHAFGAVAEMFDFEGTPASRRVAVTGGIANTSWVAQSAIDVFTGGVNSVGAAQRLTGLGVNLQSQRFFHTTTGVPGHGLVTIGGMSFVGASLDSIGFEDEIEVAFLAL